MKKRFYPWLILLCCCGMSAASTSLTNNAAALFLNPIAHSFQVGIGDVSFYATAFSIFCGLFAPPAAWLVRRFSLRALLIIAAVGAAVCQVGYANISAVWQLYVLAVIQSGFCTLLGYVPIAAIINNWFERATGFALGLSFAFSGLGNVVMNPFIAGWIEVYGWRKAFLFLGVALLFICAPAIFFCRLTPKEIGFSPYGCSSGEQIPTAEQEVSVRSPNVARPSPLLLPLLCILVFFGATIAGFGTHVASYAANLGLTASIGALMASATMAGNTLSKTVLGILCDLLTPRRACWISLSLVTIGFSILLFYPGQALPILLLGSFLVGVAYSTGNIGASALSRDLFGAEGFSAIYSKLHLVCYVGFALSCTVMGMVFDNFQSYAPCMLYGGLVALLCLLLIEVLYRLKRKT